MVEIADLTPRQIAVAALIAKAVPDKQIGATLGMNDRRVRVHVTAIAFLIGADPTRNLRIQIAIWYRERVPVTLAKSSRVADPT